MSYHVCLYDKTIKHICSFEEISLCRWSEPAWLLEVEVASVLFPSSISYYRKNVLLVDGFKDTLSCAYN